LAPVLCTLQYVPTVTSVRESGNASGTVATQGEMSHSDDNTCNATAIDAMNGSPISDIM